ncbi:hypothetical protein H7097_04165 [Aeromicrobium sp.]|nr:hypothetical protein [Candidatus Saccharibacteria bacterium]
MDHTTPQTLPSPSSQPASTADAGSLNLNAPAGAQAAPAVPVGSTPEAAADTDRIEKEWVTKTEQILLTTRDDPYEQARQLATLKADYMRKRYNKEIKLGK